MKGGKRRQNNAIAGGRSWPGHGGKMYTVQLSGDVYSTVTHMYNVNTVQCTVLFISTPGRILSTGPMEGIIPRPNVYSGLHERLKLWLEI